MACAFFACAIGCNATTEKQKPFVEINCSECDGKGKVTYDENHPFVKMGFESGTFDCPICGGQGKLYEERR